VKDGKLVQVAAFEKVALDLPAGDDPVTKIVGAAEQVDGARQVIDGYDPSTFDDPKTRADLRRAVVILGGDAKLVP
jgi:hypothetical protein